MSKRSLVAVAGLLLLAACADPSTAPSALADGSTGQRENPRDPCRQTGAPLLRQATSALRAAPEQAVAHTVIVYAQVPSCPVQ